jgi:hypothetical protein
MPKEEMGRKVIRYCENTLVENGIGMIPRNYAPKLRQGTRYHAKDLK